MITNNSKELKEASQQLFTHLDLCTKCRNGPSGLCGCWRRPLIREGDVLYEAEAAVGMKTSAAIQLVKQEDASWLASFTDREGGSVGSTPQEALCNLSDIVEVCLNKVD